MSSRELTAADCRDVLVVAITPRGPDGFVDLAGVHRNVTHLIEGGARFLMPMCGTGLVYDATLEEFEKVTGAFVDAAGGPGDRRSRHRAGLRPGPGDGRHRPRPRRGRGHDHAHRIGPASPAGVSEGLGRIAEGAGFPVVLYQRRLDIMPVERVIDLCHRDEVAGLKYAVEDVRSFRRIVDGAGGACAMVCGMAEDPSVEYLEAGAVGFSSGNGQTSFPA